MNPDELRRARVDLGWSRGELAKRSGLSHYQVSVIESGRREARPEEVEALQAVLLDQVNELIATGETPVVVTTDDVDDHGPPQEPDAVVRLTEWNGLRRGDYVRVKDLRGAFRFLYYHRDHWGEYAEVYGPADRPKERSLTIDRIIVPRRPR